MHSVTMRFASFATSCALVLIGGGRAFADDTEIFNVATGSTGNPNVLLILDTSGSMASEVIIPDPYNGTKTYSGSCTNGEIYYDKTATPTCSSSHFPKASLKCNSASIAIYGKDASATGALGIYEGNGIRWTHKTTTTNTTIVDSTSLEITNRQKTTVTVTWTDKGGVTNTSSTPSLPGGVLFSYDPGTLKVTSKVTTSPGQTSSTTGTSTNSSTVVEDYRWSSLLSTNNTSKTTTTPVFGTPVSKDIDPGYTAGSVSGNQNKTQDFTKSTETQTSTPVTTTTVVTSDAYTQNDVSCEGDKAAPGVPTLGYPNNGGSATLSEWTTTEANSYWNNSGALQSYKMYEGNYLNYLANPPGTSQGSRLKVVQDAANNLLDKLTGVNVGLMRYDVNAQGGMVMHEIAPIADAKSDLKNLISNFTASGSTPLSETLYEAYLYYSGGTVKYGDKSQVNGSCFFCSKVDQFSVAKSRVGDVLASTQYKSPITATCQNNYVVYLTDGLPTKDTDANTLIDNLPDTTCEDSTKPPYSNATGDEFDSGSGKCLAAMAHYMNHKDLVTLTSPAETAQQSVASYFIGFGSDFQNSKDSTNTGFAYLSRAASDGGGLAYSAQSAAGLAKVLTNIFTDIAERNTSFSAPTVAVNAFNRTQTLNDVFVSVFQPGLNKHWAGNVKKYHLNKNNIVDQAGKNAVDPATGFFIHAAQSYWSTEADGESVPKGGAASKLPDPNGAGARTIFTYLNTNTPTTPVSLTSSTDHNFSTANGLLNNTLLGIGAAGDPSSADLINWARGQDVKDDNKDSSTTDTRHVMGDPVHARPAVVIYGGTETDPDEVIYAPTNDGYLHAIQGGDTQGKELWAFIPQEFIGNLKDLYANNAVSNKSYALDGDVKVLKFDSNNDGKVVAADGDKVIIFFGQGRGGSRYYALDVTDKTAPQFMWSIGPTELPGIGKAWSTPIVTRAKISGATQNSQNLVLLIGGGYDTVEDTPTASTADSSGFHASDSVGNRIFMVDALTGTRLWYAGNTASANLNLTRMTHAIPSNLAVMDFDTDGYADRIYAGDLGGQVWRFDIYKDVAVADLVTGGVIASLGTKEDAAGAHTAAKNRRFYNTPDVAGIRLPGIRPFLNIAIGSGYRGHPLEKLNDDRFYSIRDYNAFSKFDQTYYNGLKTSDGSIIQDGDLTDVSNLSTRPSATASGWKLNLNYPSAQGEKILVPSTTFQNQILFTSYIPTNGVSAGACTESVGQNRIYAINAADGFPLPKYDVAIVAGKEVTTVKTPTQSDRFETLKQGGIAPELAFLFPGGDDVVCLSGAEVLGSCKSFNSRMKTYWKEFGAE